MVQFVKYTTTEEYKVKSAAAKIGRSKSVYQHTMGRDEEPVHGTMWLKGRVNKDEEYPYDEIRSVGDKLKETKDMIKEGTLKVDHGTYAMTVVLGKEKGGYARGKEANDKIKEGTLNLDDGTDAMTIVFGKKKGGYARGVEVELHTRGILIFLKVSPVDINPINSSADEEGGTKIHECENDAIKCKLWHLKKLIIIALGTVYNIDGKQMLHNKELPKDCYKVSTDTSLFDATCIPDVGNNGFKTVKNAVGGFITWLKDQVVFDPKATPPSTIQNFENKTAPKLQMKCKNVYVSSDAMQRQAKKKRSP
nr:hypothetical protein [Tanacetum cinerariifolium]